jgi:hypothetical protein
MAHLCYPTFLGFIWQQGVKLAKFSPIMLVISRLPYLPLPSWMAQHQMEMILSMTHCPRWPRQIRKAIFIDIREYIDCSLAQPACLVLVEELYRQPLLSCGGTIRCKTKFLLHCLQRNFKFKLWSSEQPKCELISNEHLCILDFYGNFHHDIIGNILPVTQAFYRIISISEVWPN